MTDEKAIQKPIQQQIAEQLALVGEVTPDTRVKLTLDMPVKALQELVELLEKGMNAQ